MEFKNSFLLSKTVFTGHTARPWVGGQSAVHRAVMSNNNTAKLEQLRKMWDGNKARFPDVPSMPPSELMSKIRESNPLIVIVDTRTAEEQQVSTLPGPCLSREEFEENEHQYKQHKVVCFCTIGMRSGFFAQALRERGFSAYNLEHSVLGWTHHGYPLVLKNDRSVETQRVHVYGQQWALQADGYEAVTFKVPLLRAAWAWLRKKQ